MARKIELEISDELIKYLEKEAAELTQSAEGDDMRDESGNLITFDVDALIEIQFVQYFKEILESERKALEIKFG